MNILDVKPNLVVGNLDRYFTLIYGEPGIGKTTFAGNIPNALLIDTEQGANAIPGIMKIDVFSWRDVKKVLGQLRKPEAQEMYDHIIIDTYDQFVKMAEEYIVRQHGVASIGDLKWGSGYTLLRQELETALNTIARYYGLTIIAHQKLLVNEDTQEKYASLAVNNTAKKIVMAMMYVVAYVESSTGERLMHFRETPAWEAKSRFAHIAPTVPFSYQNFELAMEAAIAKAAEDGGGSRVVKADSLQKEQEVLEEEIELPEFKDNFDKMQEELKNIIQFITEVGGAGYVPEVQIRIAQFLPGKLSQATPVNIKEIQSIYRSLAALATQVRLAQNELVDMA